MKKLLIFILILPLLSSCLNYIPCRGQDYIIENITHQELINKFNELREKHPEYKSTPDSKNEYVPHYYISLKLVDLNMTISCDIHIGEQIPNPPTHLKFTSVLIDSSEWIDINSKDLDKDLNENYKIKFETDILNKLGLNWKRESCW